ncbi:hypothetical protein CBS63078_7261 [Aspergillus niger]|uniref:Uncharacterized protein n=4 Tax=Aspergillus TaxID=5052 RepID=A2QJX6_ASPNC|nr:hypothetical protein An04g08610 [Aspergillus niger]XP_025450266.1 uncharacterized protein BO96DRAFT_165628 [Aspergillus niger CBS 101883]RDH17225.1 hypothetical protein M747DRAFT_103107 [Aspergillus niger ATCC 13496]RDK46805.1 hypothetical protein M752DRAFT_64273 [Aspergillus phoenicis ATCC 13157]KAI2892714.1 hypothetical protein CBS13152_4852 [Aspergillus niger]KAI2899301.1 hypothetical protein CBS63078_7261 [Aspergillus niger]KAI2962428.1 hypothetical protein CBS147323_7332 [Aspergillus |eukprot:XP_001402219.1 hypothetical protein ANI_1_2156184 [Aspergillus niger CBS 513.88]
MLHTSHPQEFEKWTSMGPSDTQMLGLESNFTDEEFYGGHLGLNGFDLSSSQLLSPELCPEFDLATGETGSGLYRPSQPMGVANALDVPRLADKITSIFGESTFNTAPDTKPTAADFSLDDLLRSASQLATERALYMNIPTSTPSPRASHDSPSSRLHFVQSPLLDDPCSSPGMSQQSYSGSEGDWDRDFNQGEPVQFYGLPDIGFPDSVSLHHALDDGLVQPPFGDPLPTISNAEASSKSLSREISFTMDLDENGLTPLEMPDGSTRFTANWLPVDPEGGFTIRAPPTARKPEPNNDSNHQMAQDTGDYLFARNAFISIPTVTGLSSTAV